jgi:hypothetical protein
VVACDHWVVTTTAVEPSWPTTFLPGHRGGTVRESVIVPAPEEVAVEYVAFSRFRQSVPAAERDAALMRRASWQYPDGVKVTAEYWPMSGEYQVVSVFAADSIAPVMEVVFEWNDVFDISVFPAVSAEEGLRVGPEVFGRLPRMQQAAG